MKGLILAGGKGTRLRPITHTAAKQLVPVANKPILFYAIEALRAAGIEEIGLIVGDTHEEVRSACGDGSRWSAKLTYIQQEAPLGLAHAVKIAEDFMAGDSFVMYLGDNLIRGGVSDFVQQFQSAQPDAMVLLAKVPNPSQFGVAELNGDGKIKRLEEKPSHPKSDLALVGVYLFTSEIFGAVHAIAPSPRGELEITDAISHLICQHKTVLPHVITGWWKDTGKLSDMLEANRIMLDDLDGPAIAGQLEGTTEIQGRVVVGKGAVLKDCTIRGPVVIGEDCRLERTFVGPYTSIGPGVTITGTEIEHSIVLAGSKIEELGGRIEGSLLGKNAEVRRHQGLPRAYQLMLGDNSQVGIP